jgi:hypothetical protein
MSNFIKNTEYDMYMYAKFEYLEIYRFLQLNISRFEL